MEDIYDGCLLDLISIITLSHRFNIVYLLLFPPVGAHITKYCSPCRCWPDAEQSCQTCCTPQTRPTPNLQILDSVVWQLQEIKT